MKLTLNEINFLKSKFLEASEKVLDIYNSNFEVSYKMDKSPLTLADLTANEILISALRTLFPNDFIVSEEMKEKPQTKLPNQFWLIDPIDGTKEFVNKTGDFTLNIGWVQESLPMWGMIYAPVYQEMYYGGIEYGVTYEKNGMLQPIVVKPQKEIVALVSRNHTSGKEDIILQELQVTQKIKMGSSLKICKLATHQADIYLRLGETSEWDIAPAHALLLANHGDIFTSYGKLRYGKPSLNNPPLLALSANFLQKISDWNSFQNKILTKLTES